MTDRPDGGPAFPSQRLGQDGLPESEAVDGMSLRDYFAGQALSGLIAHPESGDNADSQACASYIIADAMIAEREKIFVRMKDPDAPYQAGLDYYEWRGGK